MPDLAARETVAAIPAVDESRRPALSATIPVALLATVTLAYAALFGWLSLERYWAYQMHALDMGNMGQAAWNTVHGHPFAFTNMRLHYAIEAWGTTTRLSFHVEALFPLLSVVYLVYPHPESLLILQTVALAIGAVPVYLLARDALRNDWLALLFALSYLLFPTLEALNLYEFHPVALATPLLLFAFWFAFNRRYLPFAACCLLAMGTKEEIGLIVAAFGLYIALVNRDRAIGLSTFSVGLLWSLLAVLVIERHFRSPGTQSYLHTRYGYLGHGLHGALRTVLHDPGVLARVVFTWPKLGYVQRLLAPVGYLALAAPIALLLGAPTLALNLLSTDAHMYSGLGDNSAELVSVVMIAAVLGSSLLLHWLSRRIGRRRGSAVLAMYLLAMALWNQHLNGFTPIGAEFQIPVIGQHQRLANRLVSMIPASAPVSTQDQLDPHLSSRRYLYLFSDTGREDQPLVPADNILLDVSATTYPLPSYQLHDLAQGFIHRPGWGVAAASDGLILIRKGAGSRAIPSAFYSYLDPRGAAPGNTLRGAALGLQILGYDRARVDLPNYRVPNLAYAVYLRATKKIHAPLQPVLYETVNGKLAGCSDDPLGLAWLPTSRWQAGRTYIVHLRPLETDWQTPGQAHLWLGIRPVVDDPAVSCSTLWRRHGRVWPAGSFAIQF